MPLARTRHVALTISLLCGVSTACVAYSPEDVSTDHRSISKVNGGVELRPGTVAGDISTVNGGVELGANSKAGKVRNVNGGIDLGDSVSVKSLSGVNGGISAGANLRVEDDVDTVNGGLHFGPGAEIGGDLKTVNGGIGLDRAHVAGKVQFYNGTFDTGRGSRLDQGITVKKSTNWGSSPKWTSTPRIVIGPETIVSGEIVMEHETELWVHQSATIGKVSGGTAQRYSGDKPPG